MSDHKHHSHPKPRSESEYGGDTAGATDQGKVPTQAELDADRAANPSTEKQVGFDDPQSQAGG